MAAANAIMGTKIEVQRIIRGELPQFLQYVALGKRAAAAANAMAIVGPQF